jgi:transcriptional regulator with XRE-family HTH domain
MTEAAGARPGRRELGAFLRSRRERLTPKIVGLPNGTRRRTPGLRREEVALLAGVGVTWYTWLEQGRDVRASREVLAALSRALRLDPVERRHLFALHGEAPAEASPRCPEEVGEPLRRMLASLTGQPAFVLGRRWDVLAWNRAAAALFGNYAEREGDARNIMHMLFADPSHRRTLVDWEPLARLSLAMFRADASRHASDPDFERLIGTLKRSSPEFRRWWPRYEVQALAPGQKRIEHPKAGRMVFEYTSFNAPGSDLKLIVYTPLAEERSIEKLERLLRSPVERERGEPRQRSRIA